MHRRTALSVLGSALLAGCSGGPFDDDTTDTGRTPGPTDTTATTTTASAEYRVPMEERQQFEGVFEFFVLNTDDREHTVEVLIAPVVGDCDPESDCETGEPLVDDSFTGRRGNPQTILEVERKGAYLVDARLPERPEALGHERAVWIVDRPTARPIHLTETARVKFPPPEDEAHG